MSAAASASERPSFWSRAWAPAAAALVIGIIYWPRVDSIFYFLHGNEAQGIMLAAALAEGKGFVDLSLPGVPAHVREPPLFYLMLAGLIKIFGLSLYPLKLLMWAGYAAGAAAGAMFFQRRARPWLAFAAVVASFSATELYLFFTGPKSDLPFTALVLFSLLALDSLLNRMPETEGRETTGLRSRGSTFALGAAAVVLMLAAVFMRSLGLALFLAALGGIALWKRGKIPLRTRIKWGLAVAAPIILVLAAWNLNLTRTPHPAGYNYLDWFMMDLEPGSLEMMAVDFHAPLMSEIPQSSLTDLARRTARHAWLYPMILFNSLMDRMTSIPIFPIRPLSAAYLAALAAFWVFFLFGLYQSERSRPPLVLIFLLTYAGAALVWPMDDLRLLYPLFPLAGFYAAAGFYRMLGGPETKDRPASDRLLLARLLIVILLAGLFGVHLYRNIHYQRAVDTWPTASFAPGFDVRFTSPEVRDSFRVLMWARERTPPDAVLMYHSAPPCRLISGRVCSPIPYTASLERMTGPEKMRQLERIREFIINEGVDYLILDEYHRASTLGPGRFVQTTLKPLVEAFPDDFQRVDDLPGRGARALKVRR